MGAQLAKLGRPLEQPPLALFTLFGRGTTVAEHINRLAGQLQTS